MPLTLPGLHLFVLSSFGVPTSVCSRLHVAWSESASDLAQPSWRYDRARQRLT